MSNAPHFASASYVGDVFEHAMSRVADGLLEGLDGRVPDIAFLFISPEFGTIITESASRIREAIAARHIVGCTAGGILETSGEHEGGPALAVLAGSLPGARIEPFEVRHDQLLTMSEPEDVQAHVGLPGSANPFFVLLPDPFTLDADLLLSRVERGYGGAPAAGGLASGGRQPGTHMLFMDEEVSLFGAVGLAIAGAPVRTAVSQGCRPVGRRFVITRARNNKVLSLSGRPALTAIQDAIATLPEDDRELARDNLLFGRAAHEARTTFARGDFVIRNLVGVVPEEDAVLVADKVRVGQTVQLQLRDAPSATEDLDDVLGAVVRAPAPPVGALLFSCAGRGSHLFGDTGHDVAALHRHAGVVPAAGFFCNGEIGSVGGRNFVHGFTLSAALF